MSRQHLHRTTRPCPVALRGAIGSVPIGDGPRITVAWRSLKYECVYLHARETGPQAKAAPTARITSLQPSGGKFNLRNNEGNGGGAAVVHRGLDRAPAENRMSLSPDHSQFDMQYANPTYSQASDEFGDTERGLMELKATSGKRASVQSYDDDEEEAGGYLQVQPDEESGSEPGSPLSNKPDGASEV